MKRIINVLLQKTIRGGVVFRECLDSWHKALKFDPLTKLLSLDNKAIVYFVNRDLLDENGSSISTLLELLSVLDILKGQ